MSKEDAQAFLVKMKEDQGVAENVNERYIKGLIEVASTHGFEFTVEELREIVKELKHPTADFIIDETSL